MGPRIGGSVAPRFDRRAYRGAIAALVLSALAYALFAVISRELGTTLALFQQIYLRTFIALVFTCLIFRGDFANGWRTVSRRDGLVAFLRAGLAYVGGVAPYIVAIQSTSLTNVGFLAAFPSGAVIGVAFFHERLSLRKVALLGLGAAGVVLVALRLGEGIGPSFTFGYGESLAVLSYFCFTVGITGRKWHSNALRTSEMTKLFLLFGMIIAFGCSVGLGEALALPEDPKTILLLIVAGLTISAVALLTTFAFRHVSSTLGNNILILETVFIVLLGMGVYGEEVGSRELLGGGLAIASVLLLSREEEREGLAGA